ncbi:MAG: hypothetical protein PHI06_03835 [Desulfobulbaceae bacterium]|nr:hypothetical protein [Desulfobulbaceae bacterium]
MATTHKPGATLRTHHFLAASIWSLVGIFLMARGYFFLQTVGRAWLFLPASLAGTGKSIFLLDKSARKNLARLAEKKDGDCLGGVYSMKMWGLVALMMLSGILLRRSGLPAELIGTVYVAIGWALFFSSRLLWQRAISYPS